MYDVSSVDFLITQNNLEESQSKKQRVKREQNDVMEWNGHKAFTDDQASCVN